jgi:hypothetical protein
MGISHVLKSEIMQLPSDLLVFAGTVQTEDGPVSLRFLQTQEEHDYAMAKGLLPENTCQVVHIEEAENPYTIDRFPPAPFTLQ